MHNCRELMNLKMREYNYPFVLRTHWPEDVSILASTHEPEDTRMWGCEDTNKHRWTRGSEDVRMQGYKQAHMNLRIWDARLRVYKPTLMNLKIWGCEDARTRASTHESADMRMQACKQGHMIQARYKEVRVRGYKQVHTNLRKWGCKDARIQGSAQEPKDMRT